MKRLVFIIALILLLALAACDTMGPTTQEVVPTDLAPAATATGEVAAATPVESPPDEPIEEEGSPEIAGADLFGVTWEWSILLDPMGQTEVVDPTRYTAVFNSDGSLNIVADCNTVIAGFITDGFNIEIQPGISTLVACEPGSQDQLFLNSLYAVETYTVEDEELFMTLEGGSGTLVFRTGVTTDTADTPSETTEPTLTGAVWEWISTSTGEETITVNDPTRYNIVFGEDGMATIKADCNNVIASYVAGEDSSMSITLGPSTLVGCPEDSQADLLLTGLANVVLYSFIDGDLVLDQPMDSGAIRLRAAGGETAPVPAPVDVSGLTGITWEWVSTTAPAGEITVTDPTRYNIIFFGDGTAGIKADCNVGNAEYTAGEGNTLSITLGVSTLAFCEDSQDTQFKEGLSAAAAYSIANGELVITDAAGTSAMRFRAAAATGEGEPAPETPPAGDTLTGVTWQWVSTTTPVEVITATDPALYTIIFNEDGTAGIKADCNVGNAEYTTGEGGAIGITLGATTLAFCPDSQDQLFRTGLEAAAIYFFQDGDLYIDMVASSGTMRFTAAAEEETTLPGKGQGSVSPPATSGGLVGTTWQLNMITKPDGNVTINGPLSYTILFNEDGTATIRADCNTVLATYTTDEGGALSIIPGPSTLAFCGAISLDQVFIGGLTNAMSYRLEGGNLLIDMLYESGTMNFSPAN